MMNKEVGLPLDTVHMNLDTCQSGKKLVLCNHLYSLLDLQSLLDWDVSKRMLMLSMMFNFLLLCKSSRLGALCYPKELHVV